MKIVNKSDTEVIKQEISDNFKYAEQYMKEKRYIGADLCYYKILKLAKSNKIHLGCRKKWHIYFILIKNSIRELREDKTDERK